MRVPDADWMRMPRRRGIIATALAGLLGPAQVAWPRPARGSPWRLGLLSPKSFDPTALLRSLREVGYKEGRNLVLDHRSADAADASALPGLAAQLVASKPDVLLGFSNPEVATLKRATSTIPIVMMYVTEPVETGLVPSLARPGGNLTGTTTNTFSVAGKMTQVLRDTVAGVSRLAWLADPDYPGMSQYWKSTSQAAADMGLRARLLPVRSVADLAAALAELERDPPDALGVATTGVLSQHIGRVIEFAARQRLPTLYSTSRAVQEGGLMSYGPDFNAINQRIAWMVDKILKGTKPSEIPVEEPAKFFLIINKKTAKAMGLTIPHTVLLRADELLE